MEALQIIADKIGFDWRIAISHTINLGIIFFILVKFALPKLKSIIDDRNEKIIQGLKNKEQSEAVLTAAREASENIIKEANHEKKGILEIADMKAKEINIEAKKEAGEVLSNAKEIEKNAKESGFNSGMNILESKIGNILEIISNKAFAGKVNANVESEFIKNVFQNVYAKK